MLQLEYEYIDAFLWTYIKGLAIKGLISCYPFDSAKHKMMGMRRKTLILVKHA